eukprot:6283139-Amphidinium_carterae.1
MPREVFALSEASGDKKHSKTKRPKQKIKTDANIDKKHFDNNLERTVNDTMRTHPKNVPPTLKDTHAITHHRPKTRQW